MSLCPLYYFSLVRTIADCEKLSTSDTDDASCCSYWPCWPCCSHCPCCYITCTKMPKCVYDKTATYFVPTCCMPCLALVDVVTLPFRCVFHAVQNTFTRIGQPVFPMFNCVNSLLKRDFRNWSEEDLAPGCTYFLPACCIPCMVTIDAATLCFRGSYYAVLNTFQLANTNNS